MLKHPDTLALVDFDAPVVVLFVAVLHFVDNADDPAGIVSAYTAALAPGSCVAISHATWGQQRAEVASTAANVYRRATSAVTLRTAEEIAGLFGAVEIVPPGLVEVQEWRPEHPTRLLVADGRILAGVGVKP